MKKILIALAALVAFAPAAALAAGPAGVTVRVEGTSDTLLARTAVQTTTTPVVKDGNPAHSCTGTSAAGALELATAGNWSGTWYDGLGYTVDAILGEAHAFGSGHYWAEYLNGIPGNGICADELAQGDELLFAPEPESGAPDNPMYLQAPATAQRGAAFNVTVTEKVTTYDTSPPYAGHTTTQPVQGASVGAATTDANGVAAVTLETTGMVGLRATHAGDIRSATESVCVHDGNDGTCGTSAPVATTPAAPCVHNGDDGRCGTPDHKATYGFITSIHEHQHFRRGHGPRELQGTSDPDPSGLKDVQLRLTARVGRKCSTFSAARLRFVAMVRCGARRGVWFSIGSKADWTYLLPKALGPGRYVLDVKTVDGAGNADSQLARTRNRVVFFVG